MIHGSVVNDTFSLKITPLSPSTALRKAREVADMLIKHHVSKEPVPPVFFLYMDRGSEQRTNFVSVKITMIGLQKFLYLNQVVFARTAPGHSFLNPAVKVNCTLNLGFYDIRRMCSLDAGLGYEKRIHK